jgi:hypothetical protein
VSVRENPKNKSSQGSILIAGAWRNRAQGKVEDFSE